MDAPAPPQKRLRRRGRALIVWFLILVVTIVAAVFLLRRRAEAPIEVHTAKVMRGSVRDFVSSVASGRITARKEVSLRAEIAGRVLTLHKKRGETVKAGEPLLTYDGAELRERLRVAQATVELARAQALQAEQSAAVAETSAARLRRLSETGSAPKAESETLDGQAKTALRATEAARAGIAQAAANLDLARTALGRAIVRAPFDGTVLVVSVELGENVVPGAPLVQLADTADLHVDAEIDEADVGRIRVGMPADVSLDAFPGDRLRGTLREIAPSVTRDPRGGRSVGVEIALRPDPRLRVGMSADIDVIVATREAALYLPPNAVLGRGAERVVFVIEGGIAHQRTIDTGISTWEAVELRSGVEEGAAVATSLSTAQLKEGTKVKVVAAPAEAAR